MLTERLPRAGRRKGCREGSRFSAIREESGVEAQPVLEDARRCPDAETVGREACPSPRERSGWLAQINSADEFGIESEEAPLFEARRCSAKDTDVQPAAGAGSGDNVRLAVAVHFQRGNARAAVNVALYAAKSRNRASVGEYGRPTPAWRPNRAAARVRPDFCEPRTEFRINDDVRW
jgi:hypothetical protein